jgi:hypothetical protein
MTLFPVKVYFPTLNPSIPIIKSIPLLLFNIAMVYSRWPIEIDALPVKNGDFPWLC